MKTIMVTGVGAVIGYGILKSLHEADYKLRLIGVDIYADAVGQAWCDDFIQAPLTSSTDYSNWLCEVLNTQKIDLLIPGIEQDLHFFSDNRILFEKLNCKVVLNTKQLIDLSRDKWLMHQELLFMNHPSRIPSYLNESFEALVHKIGLPFLLKPRNGYASKGIIKIETQEAFQQHQSKLGNELIAQPIIGTHDDEYTVSIFSHGDGKVSSSIILQRYLSPEGATAKAWVRHIQSLDQVVKSLCAHFKPIGPTNLQFRKMGNSWYLLEINPRISSATSLRTAFGYNEANMCIQFFLDHLQISQPKIRSGFATRYIEDCVIYDRDYF